MISDVAGPRLAQRVGAEQRGVAAGERHNAVAADPGAYNVRVGRDFAEALGYAPELLNRRRRVWRPSRW